jgi:hypothetical protein
MQYWNRNYNLIEISIPRFELTDLMVAELGCNEDRTVVETLMIIDMFNQAVGRNSGYRWSDKNEESRKNSYILIDTQLAKRVHYDTHYVTKLDKVVKMFGGARSEYRGDSFADNLKWLIQNFDRYVNEKIDGDARAFSNDIFSAIERIDPDNKIKRSQLIKRILFALDYLQTMKEKRKIDSIKVDKLMEKIGENTK